MLGIPSYHIPYIVFRDMTLDTGNIDLSILAIYNLPYQNDSRPSFHRNTDH
jgi:hypothetical protein